MHRRIVGTYSVEARTLRTKQGTWKAAYILEPAASSGPRDFVMISLLDEFTEERAAVDAAMERGGTHAEWLRAARAEQPLT